MKAYKASMTYISIEEVDIIGFEKDIVRLNEIYSDYVEREDYRYCKSKSEAKVYLSTSLEQEIVLLEMKIKDRQEKLQKVKSL